MSRGNRLWFEPTVIPAKSRPGSATWPDSVSGELAYQLMDILNWGAGFLRSREWRASCNQIAIALYRGQVL